MVTTKITKTVKKYGNSGGVYLPSSWIGGEVEISLTSKPPDPGRDLILALADSMKHIISILVYGSYARDEQEEGSDIDVLIVTDSHSKSIKIPQELKLMNYDIRIMTVEEIKKAAERDVLLRKSLEDSEAIFNDSFLDEIKSLKAEKNIEERISFAKSSLGIIKSVYAFGGENTSLIYPIIMRIKEMLLIKCILENKKYSIKLLEKAILNKGITKYDYKKLVSAYRAARDEKKPEAYKFNEQVFVKLLELLEELITNAEKKEKTEKGGRINKKTDRNS